MEYPVLPIGMECQGDNKNDIRQKVWAWNSYRNENGERKINGWQLLNCGPSVYERPKRNVAFFVKIDVKIDIESISFRLNCYAPAESMLDLLLAKKTQDTRITDSRTLSTDRCPLMTTIRINKLQGNCKLSTKKCHRKQWLSIWGLEVIEQKEEIYQDCLPKELSENPSSATYEDNLNSLKKAVGHAIKWTEKKKNPDWYEEQREWLDGEIQLKKKLRSKWLSTPSPSALLCYNPQTNKISVAIWNEQKFCLASFPEHLAKHEP